MQQENKNVFLLNSIDSRLPAFCSSNLSPVSFPAFWRYPLGSKRERRASGNLTASWLSSQIQYISDSFPLLLLAVKMILEDTFFPREGTANCLGNSWFYLLWVEFYKKSPDLFWAQPSALSWTEEVYSLTMLITLHLTNEEYDILRNRKKMPACIKRKPYRPSFSQRLCVQDLKHTWGSLFPPYFDSSRNVLS